MVGEELAGALVFYGFTKVVVAIILVFGGLLLIKLLIYGPRSLRHRKNLTNLYVAGKIRQLAGKDNIDLKEEKKESLRTIKEQRKYTSSLDDTIELELQDRIITEADLGNKK